MVNRVFEMHKVDHFNIKSLHGVYSKHKNAFQWDAYRPLVDRIPACIVQGELHLPRGRCTCLGGVPAGVYLLGRVCQGCVSQHAMGQTPPCGQTDTCENITFETSFAGGNKFNQKSYLQWG